MAAEEKDIALFVCGDVMLGRGIDQMLPHRRHRHRHLSPSSLP